MKKKLLIIGKLPPPYMGPSIAFELLINSDLKEHFDLYHLDIMANRTLDTMGKFSFSKLGKNLGVYKKFANQLKTVKPDMVLIPISQTTLGFIKDSAFIWLCKRHNVRCVIQLRGSNFKKWADNAPAHVKLFIKHTLSIPQGVIVLGEKLRYLFEDYFSKDKIFVVPNGGNFPHFPKEAETTGTFTFLYLANLQSSKGIEDIIQAAALLKEKSNTPFFLKVAGQWRDPQTKASCLELVRSKQLPVEFLDPLKGTEKFRFLSEGDAFLFTPREPEGHPWVIVEAMSAGLPVISTDQGAITESVLDSKNGFIVPARDPESISLKMLQLLEDRGKAIIMGKESRKLYEERFTEQRMTARLADVIHRLCS